MAVVVDTTVLVDHLGGRPEARAALAAPLRSRDAHASEVTRLEVLVGLRPGEETATRGLLAALVWHPVDAAVAERAGELGRAWVPSHGGIDAADLAIAATASLLEAELLTTNVKHFPMFRGLTRPY